MRKLTPRQLEVLEFIQSYVQQQGYAPTIREIMQGMHLGSSSNVHRHLVELEKKGYIKRNPLSPRAITVLGEIKSQVDIVKVRHGVPTVIAWGGRRYVHDPSTIGKAKR